MQRLPIPLILIVLASIWGSALAFHWSVVKYRLPSFNFGNFKRYRSEIVQNQVEGDDPFFGREQEKKQLLEYLSIGSKPKGVLVVLGPRNSGKTRLLKEVLYTDARRRLPPIHIDARDRPITSSAHLIRSLHAAAHGWLAKTHVQQGLGKAMKDLEEVVKTSLAMVKVTATPSGMHLQVDPNGTPTAQEEEEARITPVLELYNSVIEAARRTMPSEYPVVWIDEVNDLMEWRRKDPMDMKALLNFFVLVTKQEGWAHVILSTSEYRFLPWLTKDLGFDFAQIEVIGDFSEGVAREFAQGRLTKLRQARGLATVIMTEVEWATVYDVCGGNALQLSKAVFEWDCAMGVEGGDVRPIETLEKALEGIWLQRYGELEEALELHPAFAFAASRLYTAPYGVLHRRKLDAALREQGLGASVELLVQKKLLDVRRRSNWASDVPLEAFPKRCREVVTACSAVDMYCLRALAEDGLLLPQGPGMDTPQEEEEKEVIQVGDLGAVGRVEA